MIDRYLIRYFLAVVDHGNFSRAAAQCNVSQPTLSVGIAKLEKSMDRQLFIRTNQRVELTEAGTRFLFHARRIEREFNSALNAMSVTGRKRSLRLGIVRSVPAALIARAGRECRADLPGPIELIFASERELLGQVSRGRLDAILTILRPTVRDLAARRVMEEGYAMVFPADHPLGGRNQVSAEELCNEPMIVRRHCEILSETSRHFLDRGVRPHFSLRTTNDEHALEMVGAGIGITVMPDCFRREDVRHVPLADFAFRRTLGYYVADEADTAHPLLRAIETALRHSAA